MKIQAVIFDMDGLLLNTENLYISKSKEVVEDLGFFIPQEVYHACIGINHVRTREILVESLGPAFPLEEWEKRIHQGVTGHLMQHGVETMPGVNEILETLKMQNIPLGVASSTRRANVEGLLKLGNILDIFDVLVCGDEVARSKPDPEIFLSAAEKLGADPGACLVFEDSAAGIQGAHAAGMRPVMIPDLKAPDEETARLCFRICPSLVYAKVILSDLLE